MHVYFTLLSVSQTPTFLTAQNLKRFFFLLKNWKQKKNKGYHLPLQILRMCICASEQEATDYPVKNNTQTQQQYSSLPQGTDSKGNVTTHVYMSINCHPASRTRDALLQVWEMLLPEKFLSPERSTACWSQWRESLIWDCPVSKRDLPEKCIYICAYIVSTQDHTCALD